MENIIYIRFIKKTFANFELKYINNNSVNIHVMASHIVIIFMKSNIVLLMLKDNN